MKIKAFIHLPETEAAFQALTEDPQAYTILVEELTAIKQKLKLGQDYEIYYDSSNVSAFLAVADGLVEGTYLNDIGYQLRIIFGNKSTNINSPKLRDHQFIYATWTTSLISIAISPFVVAESAENVIGDTATIKTICICLGNSMTVDKEKLFVLKDAIHMDSYPQLIAIAAASGVAGFMRWVTSLPGDKFSLKGNSNYVPLEKYWNKERIYQHKETGNFWYFDFFHRENKIHYEVFDGSGEHFGEADENGVIKNESKDSSKKITDII